jgi:hypothetical protein
MTVLRREAVIQENSEQVAILTLYLDSICCLVDWDH